MKIIAERQSITQHNSPAISLISPNKNIHVLFPSHLSCVQERKELLTTRAQACPLLVCDTFQTHRGLLYTPRHLSVYDSSGFRSLGPVDKIVVYRMWQHLGLAQDIPRFRTESPVSPHPQPLSSGQTKKVGQSVCHCLALAQTDVLGPFILYMLL